MEKPDIRPVTCYRLAGKNGKPEAVQVNMANISSCHRTVEGGDFYYARLIMVTGEFYLISEDDYFRLFPKEPPGDRPAANPPGR